MKRFDCEPYHSHLTVLEAAGFNGCNHMPFFLSHFQRFIARYLEYVIDLSNGELALMTGAVRSLVPFRRTVVEFIHSCYGADGAVPACRAIGAFGMPSSILLKYSATDHDTIETTVYLYGPFGFEWTLQSLGQLMGWTQKSRQAILDFAMLINASHVSMVGVRFGQQGIKYCKLYYRLPVSKLMPAVAECVLEWTGLSPRITQLTALAQNCTQPAYIQVYVAQEPLPIVKMFLQRVKVSDIAAASHDTRPIEACGGWLSRSSSAFERDTVSYIGFGLGGEDASLKAYFAFPQKRSAFDDIIMGARQAMSWLNTK